MRYKVGVIKKITFLFMTVGLAVALVACQGAVGKTGEPGPSGPPGPSGEPPDPVDLPPQARALTLDAVMLREGGNAADPINVADNFFDPEEKALRIGYSVDPPDAEGTVITVDLTDGMLTVAPVDAGTAVITVTATDPGGGSASAKINVTVADAGDPIYRGGLISEKALTFGDQLDITRADLDASFEGESLRYRATTDAAIVLVTQADDGAITITALDEVGKATVTIIATDEDGDEASHPIEISVVASLAPQAGDPIPNPPAPLTAGGASHVISDVSMHFTDPAGGDLMYSAKSSDNSVATAAVEGSMVTITPVAEGTAMVTVTATNTNSDGEASHTITVTVNPAPEVVPDAPSWKKEIPDVSFAHNGAPQTFMLAEYFNHATMYATDHGDGTVVTAEVNDAQTMLTLTRVGAGSAVVEITPSNSGGNGPTQSITVSVASAPTVPTLKPGKMIPATIRVVQLTDANAADTTDIDVDDFNAAERHYNLADLIRDPDGPDADLVFSTTTTDPETVAVFQKTADGVDDAATLTARREVSKTDLDEMTTDASHITIRGRKEGTATVTITATADDGDTESWPIMVTVGDSNAGPERGAGAFLDIVGDRTPNDDSDDATERMKVGEDPRKVIDDALISEYFTDANLSDGDMLTFSVKYFPLSIGVDEAAQQAAAIDPDTKELASDKRGVMGTPSRMTWNGHSTTKFTFTLTAERGTPNGDDAASSGHLVALIATDTYGESVAHVLRVRVNNKPKAEGDQASTTPPGKPLTLADASKERRFMDMGIVTPDAATDNETVDLVEDDMGYFHDPDGDTLVCRINSTSGDSGDTPVATFSLDATAGVVTVNPEKQGRASVTLACVDTFDEHSPEATLSVNVTHRDNSRQ